MRKQVERFFSLYPREVKLYTFIFLFHMCRKTLLNTMNSVGAVTAMNSGSLLLLLCIGLNFYVASREKKSLHIAVQEQSFYLYYYVFAMLSFLWSDIPMAFTSVAPKAMEVIASFLAVSVVMWKIKSRYMSMVYLLWGLTMATAIGYFSYAWSMGSIWAHTNTYSLMGAMGALLGLSMRKYYVVKGMKWLIAFNMWAMIVGTSSATYIAFIVGALVLFSTGRRGLRLEYTMIAILVVLIVYNNGMDIFYKYVFINHTEQSIETGNGRDFIWEACFNAWRTSPWLGLGFVVGERNQLMFGGQINALSAHNGYISILVNTGIIGACIFAIFLLKTIWTVWTNLNNKHYGKEMTSLFVVLVCLMVNNLSYPAFGSDWNFTMLPVMMLFTVINTLKYKIE